MSEDIKLDKQDTEPAEKKEVPVENGPNPLEVKAREMGWKPLEEFEGDEDDWIDAKEFVGRKPLFDHMSSIKRELKNTQNALREMQSHYSKVRETEYNRALNDLKAQKKQALEEGNTDALISIDDKITDLKAEEIAKAAEARVAAPQPHPNFVSWVERNKWYVENPTLRQKADEIGLGHAMANRNKSPDEVLEYVEKQIKPLLRNPNKDRPSAVDGTKKENGSKPKADDYQLTEDEERVMKSFVRLGVLTKEEYIRDLKRNKGLE